jgi:hypothetical protein
VVEGEPHGLLRSTGALDHTGGLSEDSVTLLETLNVGEDLVAVVVAVDGRDRTALLGKSLSKTLDTAIVDLDTRCDNKVLVVNLVASSESNSVILRSKTVDADVVELDLGVNELRHVHLQLLLGLETSTDKSPSRLVVVVLSRVDNSDVIVGETAGSEKLMADSETSRASSNDNDLVAPGTGGNGSSGSKAPTGLAKDRRASSH